MMPGATLILKGDIYLSLKVDVVLEHGILHYLPRENLLNGLVVHKRN